MMRKVRLLLATATGAAVLLGGAGLTASAATASTSQSAAAGDISGVSASNTYVPGSGSVTAAIGFVLQNPLGTNKDQPVQADVSAEITPPGKSSRSVGISYTPPQKNSDGTLPGTASGTGSFTISSDDPSGAWTLVFKVNRGGSTGTDTVTVNVTGKTAGISASVSPDPVNLRKGREVQVDVRASVKDAGSVSAKLVSDETNEYYDLGTLSQDSYAGSYSGSTYFSDDTDPGQWTLVVTATRGNESFKAEVGFSVVAPEDGVSKKAKTRVTLTVPKKKLAKTFKISGKAYKSGKGYSKKTLQIYYKAKGTKSYKLIDVVKTTSTGSYAKKITVKKDGYVKVKVPGTSKTRTAWSPQKFADLK
ncbi:hypothetical protein [Nonomuraea typhae]|uniref:hypothetical protein n=1 Tax=Nonomuraea typhae TaxID=2603600 RepID=UPI0012FB2B93|nr:hypothetical protein [Nonomuraea typhae]